MQPTDPKTYLWATLCRLTGLDDPGVDAMHRAVKKVVGRGTVQRIREGETSVGVDSLHALAGVFGMQVWQLLVPGVQANQPPTIAEWPLPRVDRSRWDACTDEDRAYIQGAINRALSECEAARRALGEFNPLQSSDTPRRALA